jgi:hypothetical protein
MKQLWLFWMTHQNRLKKASGFLALGIPCCLILLMQTGPLCWAKAKPNTPKNIESEQPLSRPTQQLPSREVDAALHSSSATKVSRGEFSTQLAKALGYNTTIVSEFPVFRDVELKHPHYAAIEALRERKFITANQQGYFYPDQPISRLEAFISIANAFQGIAMTPEQAELILSNYTVDTELPPADKIALARLLQEDIIHFSTSTFNPDSEVGSVKTPLYLTKPLDTIALASLVERTRYKAANANSLSSRNVETGLSDLPKDLIIELSPTQAIFEQDLSVGDTLYFIATQDVTVREEDIVKLRPDKSILADLTLLPKGTRFRGRVVEKVSDHLWTLRFNQAQTPNNYFYRTKALFPILFSMKPEKAFITPGQLFQITTTEVTSGNKLAQSVLEQMIKTQQEQEKAAPKGSKPSSKKWRWGENPFTQK